MQRLRDEVKALRAGDEGLPVVLLADGAPKLWRLYDQHLNERELGTKPVQLVDALAAAVSRIDGAVHKGIFHRKTGARYISRLASQVASLS